MWRRGAGDGPAGSPLGLHAGTVRVVPYDPAWADLFAAERRRLEEVLTTCGLSLRIEHTGSTAVPGLSAKPVLDMLAAWTDGEQRPALIDAFQRAGYVYRGEQGIPGRDFFRRGEPRQYHLHLAEVDSRFWSDHRAFRDYLRAHADVAAAYGLLKQTLAERHPTDRAAYIDGKTAFVLDVLARASA
jgi:GrpB-like predicted nucleotidyltransferase (UPF0157 family)